MSLARAWQNPILMRTQRQGARLQRSPWIILAALVIVTLLVAAVGGLAAETGDPAAVGTLLYNVFFVVSAGLVAVVGAGLAGQGLSSEFQGRTWEALLLTGMTPRRVLAGKFLSALANVLLYLAALAPVSAVAFLFGGVSALEVAFAFVFLVALAVLAVSFGLAVSSAAPQYGTVLAVLGALGFVYGGAKLFAFDDVTMANVLWPSLHLQSPVWWPAVVVRAPFDAQYVMYAWVLPIAAFALPTWLAFELAVAHVLEVGQDRYFAWKRALFVSMLVTTALVGGCLWVAQDEARATITTVIGLGLQLGFSAALAVLVADDVYPFRRARHELLGQRALRRLMGPSVLRSSVLFLLVWMVTLLLISAAGAIQMARYGAPARRTLELALLDVVVIPFALATAGLLVLLRTGRCSPLITRILVLVTHVGVVAAPWVLYAIAGGMQGGNHALRVLAAPSPFYFFTMLGAVEPYSDRSDSALLLGAGVFVAIVYVVLAMTAFAVAARRTRTAFEAEIAYQYDIDQRLAAEDMTASEASPPAAPDAAVTP